MATIFKSTGHAQFDKLLEKATSNLLLEPEWASIIQICDLIRQKDCHPKYAIGQLKKKLHHSNPHVSYYALQVLESVVKNCGSPVHEEISTKQFMEELKDLAKTSHHDNIREKILELIQTWAHAFRKIPSYRAVQDVLNIMKTEGAKFPPLAEADAMFVADQAPEWADGECCHRCRVEFSFTQRKHHCRACGQIFCSKCSSKECTLPRFGIEKEVRVCDACFEKYGRDTVSSAASSASGNSSSLDEHVHLNSSQRASNNGVTTNKQPSSAPAGGGDNKPTQKELELAEEEQLQLALAISQSEAEAKEQELKNRNKRMYTNTSVKQEPGIRATSPPPPQSQASSQDDPELSRYLNRAYWENKSNAVSSPSPQLPQEKQQVSSSFMPSAPLKLSSNSAFQQHLPEPTTTAVIPVKPPTEEDQTIDMFLDTLRTQIEMFVNRMKSNSSRGRPIANDTSVQSLFMSITHMHSQLLTYIQVQDNARGRYELLQDKLNQVRDARAALDDLRNEHAEELRRQQEEQERIRAYQMAQKLALMRQKKNEYLQYQRQLAMQRMQEQEREMQMRIAQQGSMGMGAQPGQMPPWGVHPGYPPHMGHPQQAPPQGGPGMYQQSPQPPQQQQWMNNQPGVMPPGTPQQQPGGMPIPPGTPQQQQPPTSQIAILNSPTNSNPHLHIQQQQQPPPPGGMMYGGVPNGQTVSDPNIPNSQPPQQMQMPPHSQPDPNNMMMQQQQQQVNCTTPQSLPQQQQALPPQQMPPQQHQQQIPPPQQPQQMLQQQQIPPQQQPPQQQELPQQQQHIPQQPPQQIPPEQQQQPPPPPQQMPQQHGPAPVLPDQQQQNMTSPPPHLQIAELISFD